MEITHLMFADDPIIFCQKDIPQWLCLRCILMWKIISGLHVNLAKSELISVREGENDMHLALAKGCKMGTLPISYLGLPLGAAHNVMEIWDPVIEKFEKKLASWKRDIFQRVVDSHLQKQPYRTSLCHFSHAQGCCSKAGATQLKFLWGRQ